jgi:uncharacterized membrane protein
MYVNLTAPADADANIEIKLEIIGTVDITNYAIIPAELHAQVIQTYDTSISTQNKITFSSPVEQQNLVIQVENHGNGDDKVTLELTNIPEGLTLSAEAKGFIIGHGDTEYFTITLFPSSILTAGSYNLNLSMYRITTEKEWVSSQNIVVEIQYYPDLYLSYDDIEISKYVPIVGEDISINVTIHNKGDSDARNFSVSIIPITRSGS